MSESVLDAMTVWGAEEPSMHALIERLDVAQSERLLRIFNIILRRTRSRYTTDTPFTLEGVLATPELHGAFLVCHAYFFS